VRLVTGVLRMARCLRAAGVRHLAVAEENAAEAALVDSLAMIGVADLEGRHSHAGQHPQMFPERRAC
jgi:predicted ATPase with chaperone activity